MISGIDDLDLELGTWGTHLPNDGSQIGGVMPTAEGLLQDLPGAPGSAMLFVQGPAYATMEAYTLRPNFVTLGLGYVTERFTLTIDDRTPTQAQVIESDLIRIVKLPDGTVWKFDGSFQVYIAAGWMLQVDGPTPANGLPSWRDTGIKIPPMVPNVPHQVAIVHFSDIAAKTHSVLSYSIDGTVYAIPPSFGNIPATPSTWTPDRDLPQFQITTSATGHAYDLTLTGVALNHRAAK